MIIDVILDRKDGVEYDAREASKYMYDEAVIFEFDYLVRALDSGTNKDVQDALCKYIDKNDYNPDLKDYIRSQIWVED